MAIVRTNKWIDNPVISVDGNPINSYNPVFENHTIDDQTIVSSSGYLAHLYDGVEYRKYLYKNANDDVVKISAWEIHEEELITP